jgi:4-amino-4-deoxy-L-arabinose transferase-like glycosyltransferase
VTTFDRRVVVVAATLFAALLSLSGLYGFHRDELYFLDAGRHIQGGYVDQPAVVPLLARLSSSVFGVSLPGLRLWPALAGFATVIVAGLTARELGGQRRAQLLAAVAAATMPAVLAIDHLLGPTAIDLLVWATLALLVLRVDRTGDTRLWVLVGIVVAVGVANKHSVVFFALALIAGTVASGGWSLIGNRWLLAGAVIAALGSVPDLVWQSQHGWATVEMTRTLNSENGGLGNVAAWVGGQLIMTAVALVPMWIAGLRSLWASGRPLRRAITIAYLVLFVFFAVTTGAKIYYLAGAYIPLLAAGAVAFDQRFTARGRSSRSLLAWTAVTTVIAFPLVLPVLPPRDIGWTYAINQVPGESLGWNTFVSDVQESWSALPGAAKSRTAIITSNYGEAGAINELGRGRGLPHAFGTHNSEWWWGPPPASDTDALALAPGPVDVTGYDTYLRRFFAQVTPVATFHNVYRLRNEEWGGHVYLCKGLRRPWSITWREMRHYG